MFSLLRVLVFGVVMCTATSNSPGEEGKADRQTIHVVAVGNLRYENHLATLNVLGKDFVLELPAKSALKVAAAKLHGMRARVSGQLNIREQPKKKVLYTIALEALEEPQAKEKTGVQIVAIGALRHPVFALGGETTGTTLGTPVGEFELDLPANATMRQHAEKLDGKRLRVSGKLRFRKGLEAGERRIITLREWKQVN